MLPTVRRRKSSNGRQTFSVCDAQLRGGAHGAGHAIWVAKRPMRRTAGSLSRRGLRLGQLCCGKRRNWVREEGFWLCLWRRSGGNGRHWRAVVRMQVVAFGKGGIHGRLGKRRVRRTRTADGRGRRGRHGRLSIVAMKRDGQVWGPHGGRSSAQRRQARLLLIMRGA